MKNQAIISVAVAIVASMAAAQAQSTITDWSFDAGGAIAAPYNNPTPSTGSGFASVLGMDNSYNGTTSTAAADVVATAGASTGAGSFAWRVRGTPGNGWSSSAPIGTQGAEFDVPTTGYDSINLSFDVYFTTQAPAKLQVQYTTDGSAWVNAAISYAANPAYVLVNTTSANTVTGTYFYQTGGQNFYNDITASFPAAANEDNNFGIRIVNAATGVDNVNYLGTAYNNNSGNWRFDNVLISGTAVPEPSSLALVGIGVASLIAYRRNRKA